MKITLDTPVSKLRMVGPAYSKRLNKLNIKTVSDLLYHPPHRYEDRSKIVKIKDLKPSSSVTIIGKIISIENTYTRNRKPIQKAVLADSTGRLPIVWFNQPFLVNTLVKNPDVSLFGKVDYFGSNLSLVSPEYELLKTESLNAQGSPPSSIHTARLVPIYPETSGLSSKWLRSRIYPLLKFIPDQIDEFLPHSILKTQNLLPEEKALQNLHFPETLLHAEQARKRLAYNEIFLMQLDNHLRKKAWSKRRLTKPLKFSQTKIDNFIKSLPFKLTAAQKRVTNEILNDLRKKHPMNRLLQGDVGSGKTVVACIAVYASYLSGEKSVFMAPTEILANQHYQTAHHLLSPFNLKIALCTGSRKMNLDKFDLAIGTHALLYDSLKGKNYSLAVIDEQHRFGVEQRSKLIRSAESSHVLTMTATPIPRSVALTLFGDLDLSTIDELPPGRKAVKTWVVPPQKRSSAYDWIKQIIKKGEQVFIVCPLIEESQHETMQQVKAAAQEFEKLKTEIFPDQNLSLLHGRLPSRTKQEVIEAFKQGKSQILVTTPVVEVGIDIPQATVMLIEAAERFGLSQLHQLRGRVGRSQKQSYCLLFTSSKASQNLKRLKAMEAINLGLELAELDLRLRGPGQIYGTLQHGFPDLKFADFNNLKLISTAKQHASPIIDNDPQLKKQPLLRSRLSTLEKSVEPN